MILFDEIRSVSYIRCLIHDFRYRVFLSPSLNFFAFLREYQSEIYWRFIMKTFAVAGCGHLGKIVQKAYINGLLKDYKLVAAYSRELEDAEELVKGTEAVAAASMDEVISLKPDYIIETASIALLKDFALDACAERTGAKIYIPSGAVGGFDVLRTIALIAEAEGSAVKAGIHTHKGPNSLKNTPLYEEVLQEKEKTVFSGSTSGAIGLLPTKVNVAVASALATIGPDNAKAEITSVPEFIGDDHCITVETDGLKAVVDIYSATSDIAAWSVVALMRNLSSSMVFF